MKLSDTEQEQACEIVDIQFAMSDYQYLQHVLNILEKSAKIQKIDLRAGRLDDARRVAKLEAQKEKLLAGIEVSRSNYYQDLAQGDNLNQALCAIVVFRSMEGVQRAKRLFKVPFYKQLLYKVCCRCCSNNYANIMFKGKFFSIKTAVEPELLIWQNFGVTKKQRCVRIFLFGLFVLIMLSLCFYAILSLEYIIQKSEMEIPDIVCPDTVLLSQASVDYQLDPEQRNGNFHCFCSNLYNAYGYLKLKETIFPVNGEANCLGWYSN